MRAIIVSTTYTQTPPSQYGGMEYIAFLLAKTLSSMNIETWLVASSDSPEPAEIGADYNLIKTIPVGNSEESHFVAFRDHVLDKELIPIDEDTVFIDHTHEKWMYTYKKDHPEINLMGVIHDAMPYGSSPPIRCPCMIGISKSQLGKLSNHLGIHIELAYNGIDLSKYPPGRYEDNENYMLFISRITTEKAPHEAIYISNETGIPLIIAGDDSPMFCDQIYVHSIISKCDGNQIKYLGSVSHEKKVELMQRAEMTLLPIGFDEPFGLVAVESMACGTPVISLDRGAYEETILGGGFVCDDVDSMAETATSIHNKLMSMAPESVENAAMFSSDRMALRYIELMKKCIGNPW